MPVAQALAVKNGRIVEVGGSDEILWLREADYEVIDLDGLTITPGFVDPHNHFSIGAFETLWADCRGAGDIEADLVVLSANPVECRTEDIASIEVLQTWARGVRIFNRP